MELKRRVVALAGNPNVGKSTLFNRLTGLHQHTGNWPGKTVSNAVGRFSHGKNDYLLADLPGSYSLLAHSPEEEAARDFLCFGNPDACIVVCDAGCLKRNLNLVYQVRELIPGTIVCLNLMDEAEKKGVTLQIPVLEELLGVPVAAVTARNGAGMEELLDTLDRVCAEMKGEALPAPCLPDGAKAAAAAAPALEALGVPNSRWAAMRLLEGDDSLRRAMVERWHLSEDGLRHGLMPAEKILEQAGLSQEALCDGNVQCMDRAAGEVCRKAVQDPGISPLRRKLDRLLTGKWTGIPLMLLLLALVFWITVTGANIPSQLLSDGLFALGDWMQEGLKSLGTPVWLEELLILGIWRTLAWVVSVMLPPMAIFFPLFTLLEDLGYLPRAAFTLDHCFQKAKTCGKQALTMCMGFGCNAAGVTGCRIIDSPRERLVAILTNSFVPCNGRFPTMITLITLFFAAGSVSASLFLTGLILLGVLLTFGVSRLLSETVLRGTPSSFAMELPPLRKPQIGQVLVRSVLDRTLFVLARAVSVAAPAGLVLWLLANLTVNGETLLTLCAGFLDPLGQLMGLDGTILLAFVLGFPANEIVLPIALMGYLSQGHLVAADGAALGEILRANGWTWVTALCTLLFSLLHWPCSTTCLTIKKETGSWKWTALAFVIPTVCGMVLCMAVNLFAHLTGLG